PAARRACIYALPGLLGWRSRGRAGAGVRTAVDAALRLASAPAPFERDALEHVRNGLAGVDGCLERLEDVLPADHDHRVDATGEQRGDTVALEAIALVLEAVDLDQVGGQLGARAQRAQRLRDLLACADEHLRELDRLLHRRLDPVQPELGADVLRV